MLSDDRAFELINRRRRQLHVHSTIYYHMNTSIIDDALFDKFALELASLQRDFPQFKNKGYMSSVFADWTGDTGMHLPVTDAIYGLAEWLLEHESKRNGTGTRSQKKRAPKASTRVWEGDVGYEVN